MVPVVISSRITSRRLPRKVFSNLAGKTTLDHILSRLKPTGLPVILAVPPDEMETYRPYAQKYGAKIFCGWPDSPLHRTADALKNIYPNTRLYCRVTHDDPLPDSQTILELIAEVEKQGAGYGFSPGIIEGAGVEVISTANLHAAAKRFGPTEYISYYVKNVTAPEPGIVALPPRSSISRPYRMCLDYPEDALVLNIVLRATGPDASLDDIARYLDTHGHILNFNRLPTVSVYTCVYNGAPYIEQAMRSVLSSAVDLEYIVVDDGSTDDTLEKVARFAHDKRLRVILNESNIGLASSSNKALAEARGRWVLRLDGDDVLLQGGLEGLVKDAEDSGSEILYPSFHEIGQDGKYLRMDVDPGDRNHAGGALMLKSYLNEMRFRDGLRLGDSAELFKRAMERGAKVGYGRRATWLYRKHPASLTAGKA